MYKKAIFFLLLNIFSVPLAHAEYCNMVGGAGEIEWIYIPKTQYNFNGQKQRNLNGKTYKYDRKNRLFKEDKLPLVNETVTLNKNIASNSIPVCLAANTCSEEELEHWEIIKKLDGYDPDIYNEEQGTAEINDAAYQVPSGGGKQGNWDLNEGAELRIMGYTYVERVLFALVYVVSC